MNSISTLNAESQSYGEHEQLPNEFQEYDYSTTTELEGDGGNESIEIVTTTVDIPLFLVGWVIGRGGRRIQELQMKTNCKIWMDQNKAANSNSSKLLNIEGCEEHVQFALTEISDLLSSAPIVANDKAESGGGIITEVLSCPQPLLGLLIGRNGWTLKRIIRVSGANITINQSVLPTQPRRVIVYGTADNVALAKSLVERVLSAQSQADAVEMMTRASGSPGPGSSAPNPSPGPQFAQSQPQANNPHLKYPFAQAPIQKVMPAGHQHQHQHQHAFKNSTPASVTGVVGGNLSSFGEQVDHTAGILSASFGLPPRPQLLYSTCNSTGTGAGTGPYTNHSDMLGAHHHHQFSGYHTHEVPEMPTPPQRRSHPSGQHVRHPQPPSASMGGYVDHQQLAYLHRMQQAQAQQLQELEKKQREERDMFLLNMQQQQQQSTNPEESNLMPSHLLSALSDYDGYRTEFGSGASRPGDSMSGHNSQKLSSSDPTPIYTATHAGGMAPIGAPKQSQSGHFGGKNHNDFQTGPDFY